MSVNGAKLELSGLDTRAGAEGGFWLQLRDPVTGEEVPARLRLLGSDAEACYLKFRAHRRVKLLTLFGKAPEEAEFNALLDLLEAATVGWEGLQVDGQDYPFAPEAVRKTYLRWRWMVDLAEQAIVDRANFLPGSARS